jgi:hypothetical protein
MTGIQLPAGTVIGFFFFFATASRPTLGPSQLLSNGYRAGAKRPGRETDHSPPSIVEVKNVWSYTSALQYVFRASCLVTQSDNFTFCINLTPFTEVVGGGKKAHRNKTNVKAVFVVYILKGRCLCT